MNQENEYYKKESNEEFGNESDGDHIKVNQDDSSEYNIKEVRNETNAIDWIDWLETNIDWNLISISSIWIFLTLTFFGIMF